VTCETHASGGSADARARAVSMYPVGETRGLSSALATQCHQWIDPCRTSSWQEAGDHGDRCQQGADRAEGQPVGGTSVIVSAVGNGMVGSMCLAPAEPQATPLEDPRPCDRPASWPARNALGFARTVVAAPTGHGRADYTAWLDASLIAHVTSLPSILAPSCISSGRRARRLASSPTQCFRTPAPPCYPRHSGSTQWSTGSRSPRARS
jgi:hypothetical protein